jgi:sarcosine/dimethylglycine N-methyltransferase
MSTADAAHVARGTDRFHDGVVDPIYHDLWGDTRHIGIFEDPDETVHDAMARVTERLGREAGVTADMVVLEAGCGHGAVARHLSAIHGCRVMAIDTSDLDLTWGAALTRAAGLADRVRFAWADLHALPYENCSFDVYWAQESFLPARSKHAALEEAARVLKPGGRLVLTDLVVRRATAPADRAVFAEQMSWPEMWDTDDYRLALCDCGFAVEVEHDWSDGLALTYGRLRRELAGRHREFEARRGRLAVEQAAASLRLWSTAAEDDKIGWIHLRAKRL